MKHHLFLQAGQRGIIDIDKKIPFIKTLFPDSKIEKKPFIGMTEFIIVKDIMNDVKLTLLNGVACDIKLQIDFYTTALFGYSFLDIQYDVSEEIATNFGHDCFLIKSNILLEGKEQSVSHLLTEVLWKYYQSEKMIEIMNDEKFVDLNKIDYESIREEIFDKIGIKLFYSAGHLPGGMSGSPGYLLIEDYDNKIPMDDKWIDVGANENQVYNNAINTETFVLKEKDHFNEFFKVTIEIQMEERFLKNSSMFCSNWIQRIGSKVEGIRKNILANHNNKFYWKELKKDIEVIDLNFLEYQTTVIRECNVIGDFPDTMDLGFSKEFKKQHKELMSKRKDSLYKILDEIKYSISNLATPGHTHDEHLLQEETEKVHEMLLMISFIAMAIPSGVAITTPNISMIFKIIAAFAIFSIPIIYFIFRKTQKILAYKRNVKSELKRQYKSMSHSLVKEKEHMKITESIEELPEDLKESIIKIQKIGIDADEKRLRKLEKYK